jgi:hypothetical protein
MTLLVKVDSTNKGEFSRVMHSEKPSYTVSLGGEGNGPNFPAHIGAYIALLENNFIPTVLIGGSSASVTGSLLFDSRYFVICRSSLAE